MTTAVKYTGLDDFRVLTGDDMPVGYENDGTPTPEEPWEYVWASNTNNVQMIHDDHVDRILNEPYFRFATDEEVAIYQEMLDKLAVEAVQEIERERRAEAMANAPLDDDESHDDQGSDSVEPEEA